jgi:hypothetical protein
MNMPHERRPKVKVFISWSGQVSRQVAEALRNWLPSVLQTVEPYVSSEDIYKGVRWSVDVSKELETSTYGILCVTQENIGAPWLNFEAGALSKSFDMGRVSPFLFGISNSDLTGPLAQFQSTMYEQGDVFKLIKSINAVTDTPLDAVRLKAAFDRWWPELLDAIESVKKLAADSKSDHKPARGVEVMVAELLDLVREQQKVLTNLLEPHAPSRSSPKGLAAVPVDRRDITFLLGRLRGASNWGATPNMPETAVMVQVRALVMLLAEALSPMIDSGTYESIARQYDLNRSLPKEPDTQGSSIEQVDAIGQKLDAELPAIATIQSAWPEVLDAVKAISKVAWVLLSRATPTSLKRNTLAIEFPQEVQAKRFAEGGHDQALAHVFRNMFAVADIRIKPSASDGARR